MAVVVLSLIEINERIKAKRTRDTGVPESPNPEDCDKNPSDTEACAECGLQSVCEKDKSK